MDTVGQDVDYASIIRNKKKVLPDYIKQICRKLTDEVALIDKYSGIKVTFAELDKEISLISAGLQKLGLKKGDKVALFSENNARWLIADQSIMRCGAVDAVRGSKTTTEELEYILEHSDSVGCIVYNDILFQSLKNKLLSLKPKFVIIMFHNEENYNTSEEIPFPIFSWEELREYAQDFNFESVEIVPDDDATIIYTSGTTSTPKGVLLTHSNLISQVKLLKEALGGEPGDSYLCILPVWHAYERSVEYYFFSNGVKMIYTNIKNIKSDIAKYHTTYICAVPRIWDSLASSILVWIKNKSSVYSKIFNFGLKISKIHKKARRYLKKTDIFVKEYNIFTGLFKSFVYLLTFPLHFLFSKFIYKKITRQFGIDTKAGISGGGALSHATADFYDAINVKIVIGYGLTETSPVIALNHVNKENILYTAGKPLPYTHIKIVDINTGEDLPNFQKGIVMIKGAQVMKGYYKNQRATEEIISDNGWLNTGDIGWMNDKNDLILTGRQKEIIVLSNGENVEPVPIEQACLESKLIKQIMLVGQDKSSLGALVLPSDKAFKDFCLKNEITIDDKKKIIENSDFQAYIKKEVWAKTKVKNPIKSYERISKIALILEEFSVQNGLVTMSGKMKRNVISDRYKTVIENLYK